MEITVLRLNGEKDDTIGLLFVDGKWFGFTIEDEYRSVKVAKETRIPAGSYEVELRKAGKLHEKYGRLYPWHEGMLHIRNVPNFKWIYFHRGVRESHTDGCIPVADGVARSNIGGQLAELGNSAIGYERFYRHVLESCKQGDLRVNIHDEIKIGGILDYGEAA